ncbi:MAG TPA: hypothetical protein VFB62_12255 [Polyangiaceae bacterium]|nr:hypothetical protein [Polyangiaceae bacterium]
MDTLARAAASALGRIPDGTVIASAALESSEPAPRGNALTALILEHVAGRLGARVDPEARSVEDARKRARRAPGIVLLRPRIAQGRLHLGADVYASRRTVWTRARAPQSGPVAHAYVQAPIDAEVRSYLEPIAFEAPRVSKYREADPDIVALACGDLDGDGGAELLTMTRSRVLSVKLRDGKVARLREARWEELAPIAPVPLRQPLGFVTIVEPAHAAQGTGYVDASLTDRSGSVRLDADLKLLRRMPFKALPVAHATGCTWVVDLLLGEELLACDSGDPPIAEGKLRHRSDAFASTFATTRAGEGRTVFAMRRDGAVVVKQRAEDVVVGRAGAQLAVADLDQDGDVEIMSTMDVLAPRFDALEVRTLLASGTVKTRYKLPVPTGVQAVAACPSDGAGPRPVVLASQGEIWVVR